MASKSGIITAILLINIVFSSIVTATNNPYPNAKCPIDTLKLGVCVSLLDGLLGIKLGKPPSEPCCGLIRGLVDVDAAACVCTALKAKVLGIRLNIPLALSLLLNRCGCKVANGFICA